VHLLQRRLAALRVARGHQHARPRPAQRDRRGQASPRSRR
jgi:hypothetical protein